MCIRDSINGVHLQISFMMETEIDQQLAFVDVLVLHTADSSPAIRFTESLCTLTGLHKLSNHHPRQKRAVLKTLVDWARRTCEPQFLDAELGLSLIHI